MPSESRPETPADHLRTMRFISVGMLFGPTVFLALGLYVRPNMIENATGAVDLVAYLAVAFALLSLPIASILRAARGPSLPADQDPEYWPRRRGAHVVSLGILEGAAYFCCIALLVSKPIWPLLALIVPMGGMVAWFPRDE